MIDRKKFFAGIKIGGPFTSLNQKQIWELHFKTKVSYSTVKKFIQKNSFKNI